MSDALRRAIRTLLQLVAAGGLTALIDAVSKGLTPFVASVIMAAMAVVVTFVHNYLEDTTSFPALLKATPSAGQNPVTQDPAT